MPATEDEEVCMRATTNAVTFGATFAGETITPDHPEYDRARTVWNGSFDRRPAVIGRCSSTADVIEVVKFARESGLPLAVRGGGHSLAGLSAVEGGVVLDLSRLQAVEVDPESRIARVEPGVTWGTYDAATQAKGLASTGGLISTTGVSGLTLGGGIGWLMRRRGLACDNLLAAEVVTASGDVLRANASEAPELLWGLRGGGGNFGVVTRFEFRVHPMGPVVGGLALWPIERGREVLRAYRDWAAELPDEFTTMAAVITAPPAAFVPAGLAGRKVVALLGCWCGGEADGIAALAPMRKLGPTADVFGPMPYAGLQSMLDEGAPPGMRNYVRSGYLPDMSDALIDVVLEHGARMPSPFSQLHLHQMGGAVARVGEHDTAFGHRRAAFAYNIVSTWVDRSEDGTHERANRDVVEAMGPFATDGVYVNFLGNEGQDRVRAAYGEQKYARLARLKRELDPGNLFRLNQNIEPA
jgi:FAD/FMN-containing dehydrogenase